MRVIISKRTTRYKTDFLTLYSVQQVQSWGAAPYVRVIFHSPVDGTSVDGKELLAGNVGTASVEHSKVVIDSPCPSSYVAPPAKVILRGEGPKS